MKRILIFAAITVFGLSLVLFLNRDASAYILPPLDSTLHIVPQEVHEKKASLVIDMLTKAHYKKMQLNDSMSSVIFDNYIHELDPNKIYFLKSDLQKFEKYKLQLDNELLLKTNNLNVPYEIYNTYLNRVRARMQHNQQLLDQKIDLNADEYYETDRKKVAWANSNAQLDQEWIKIFKNQIIISKLAGDTYQEAIQKLKKRYKRYLKTLSRTNAEDIFETYLNVITESFDPHTSYFSPINSDNFNNSMKRSLEGIGAVLSSENDYTVIKSVKEGGPAFKSKQLFKEDRIIGVAQGEDGEMVDIVGWRLDEAIQLIRGKKGTVVRLSILPASEGNAAKPKEVRMVREKITFEEQSSTKKIITYQQDGKTYKIGVIGVPSFYLNFKEYREGKKDYKSTTNDVRKILEYFKTQNINGLIIDLRYNGGGSLIEAIDLTSLFVNGGPVVQVKNSLGRIEVGKTQTVKKIYDGPMVVMVNRFSASASEIFTAAIQDYKRGVVVGEDTYGKGTVQSMLYLSKYLKGHGDNIGHLNLTLSKYYRITGNSTQRLGVKPDLKVPSIFSGDEYREIAEKSALAWDEIPTSKFKSEDKVNEKTLKYLQKKYKARKTKDEDLKKLIKDIRKIQEKKKKTKISLNEAKRRKEYEADKKENEEDKKSKEDEEDYFKTKKQKEDYQYGELKDLYLKNAIQILTDLVNA